MNRTVTIFLVLLFVSSVSAINKTNSTDKLQGSKSGIITIFRNDYGGFYVGADFKYDYSRASGKMGAYTYELMLGLYTSQTLLPSYSCAGFSSYDCSYWSCSKRLFRYSVNYPYLTATGVYAGAEVYLDYFGWSLFSDALYADSCTTRNTNYGQGRYGILGMGIYSYSKNNFGSAPIFSIHVNKDLKGGKLLLSSDFNYASSAKTLASIPTNSDWQSTLIGNISVGVYPIPIYGKLIFDINADAIGVPSYQFSMILDMLKTYGVDCYGSSFYQPSCSYSNTLSSLPNITISNSVLYNISIPPEIYVVNSADTGIIYTLTLNLKAIGTGFTGKNYVTAEYNDAVILDSRFMRYYYTVFDASVTWDNPHIYLYSSSNNAVLGGPGALFIVLGIVAFIILIIAISCCCRARTKPATIVTHTTAGPAPLIINQDQTNMYVAPHMQYVQQPQPYMMMNQQPQPMIYTQPMQPGVIYH